ncbi:helix-turn-helix domain-containing protein [Streptomyces sp. NPDC087525]|uniref:helix-turn-helix domain-containing protein n=1 Tax=Streptomyces sp. NPDC087525 TaxID=3365793 RepID=UPI003803B0BC
MTEPNPRKYLKGDERIKVAVDLKTRYEEGGSTIRQLAEETGYSHGAVCGLLHFVGTRMRPGAVDRDRGPGSEPA